MMSDNNNDIEIDDDFASDDGGFDGFDQPEKGTLADLWRNNPVIRIGVIALGAIFIFGTIIIFSGGEAPVDKSNVGSGSDVVTAPGTQDASEVYVDAVRDKNEQVYEDALRSGGSALPTPIEPPIGRVNLPIDAPEDEDPLQRWRRLQEERLERELQVQQTVEPEPIPEQTSNVEQVQRLADSFVQQMQSVLERQGIQPMQYRGLSGQEYILSLEQRAEEEAQASAAAAAALDTTTEVEQEIIIPAGEIEFGQFITEANSDAPGPVLVQMLSGPLQGSRLIGDFQRQGTVLTVNFSTAVVDGQSIGISAVAIDPDTTLPGLASDVNLRLLQRLFLPAAAAFVTGLTDAIANSGRTTLTIDGDTVATDEDETDNEEEIATGVSEFGEEVGDFLDEIADNTDVLVRIERGTPLGILFLEPVVQDGN